MIKWARRCYIRAMLPSFTDEHSTNPLLDEQCRRIISDVVDCFDDAVQHMLTGQIPVATVKFILDHKRELTEMYATLMTYGIPLVVPAAIETEDSPIDVLQRVLEWRESELHHIENRKKDIQNMLGMVTKLKSGR